MRTVSADASGIAEAINVLKQGGVIMYPTETCYGIGCDLTNKIASKKLFALKKRPMDLPVSALFASIDQSKHYIMWNDEALSIAKKYLPGPLTIIMPMRNGATLLYLMPYESLSTVGIRISSHPVAMKLAASCSFPIATTSANLHGKPEAYSVDEIMEQYQHEALQPDLIIDGGVLPTAKPSTIIEMKSNKAITLRQGDILVR